MAACGRTVMEGSNFKNRCIPVWSQKKRLTCARLKRCIKDRSALCSIDCMKWTHLSWSQSWECDPVSDLRVPLQDNIMLQLSLLPKHISQTSRFMSAQSEMKSLQKQLQWHTIASWHALKVKSRCFIVEQVNYFEAWMFQWGPLVFTMQCPTFLHQSANICCVQAKPYISSKGWFISIAQFSIN